MAYLRCSYLSTFHVYKEQGSCSWLNFIKTGYAKNLNFITSKILRDNVSRYTSEFYFIK